ncbi:MAG: DUF1566 domain-containing protein [Verrucomicrobia bacterium]|nr:DUF1566 domain-containing protein [Verrucomicrobiota bacterium]
MSATLPGAVRLVLGSLLSGSLTPVAAHSWHDDTPVSAAIAAARAELLAQWIAEQSTAGKAAAPLHGAKPAPVVPGTAAAAPAGYGSAMAASFGAFRPRVRSSWDATTFYVEGDSLPDPVRMPEIMVGITSWQQQIPLPVSYFAGTTNPERDVNSIGFGRPNVWRLPLVPTPAAAPIPISAGNFQRGAIAVGADGIAIFNPRNNTGRVSYEIGELDRYGGHCGMADDYHYHLAPVHLQAVLGTDQPVAWALDGYPIYGYTEPDSSARQPLDAEGGHTHGAWAYHYHAIGSAAAGPQSPYLPAAFHGTVINYGGQVDGQPEVQALRANNTGGYVAQAIPGARIVAYKNPVALDRDAAGDLVESPTGTPSTDQYLMRFAVGTTNYDLCWRINRQPNPKTLTITWRRPGITPTTTTYNNTNNRLTAYPRLAGSTLLRLPDTGQTIDGTATFGEDSDYTINPPAYRDNGDGTITDLVTGLMWQKVDAGESTWEAAIAQAASVTTGGYTDWRLPTPGELFSLMNYNNGNPAAMNLAYFPVHPAGAAEYWWTSEIYGSDASRVWCVNSGGGMGPKPKTETLGAGGRLRYHTRYVRGAAPTSAQNFINNLDGTITDADLGLMWTQVPAAARDWNAAIVYAESLTLGGYTDWRLPNIKELQTLTDYSLATATTAASALACVNRVMFPSATTPATAYWSSTVLRAGNGAPTSAWLLELGVNTTVPAANGPPRGAQGIISYETMGASYPVWAVRNVAASRVPVITSQPRAYQTATVGSSVTLTVTANSDSPLRYQWRKDGVLVAGGTGASLAFPSVRGTDVGTYTVSVSNDAGTVASTPAVVALGTARLANLSIRSTAGAGNDTLIVGFVVGNGTAPSLLVRGIGPTLAAFGVPGAVADPVLTVHTQGGAVVAVNDDWGSAPSADARVSAAVQAGAFALPTGSRDSALLSNPRSGAYTVQLAGKAATAAVALVEAYDVAPGPGAAPLVNLSARTRVGTGAEVLIAGFVVAGTEPKRLLIRAVGPGLAGFGVGGILADPQLVLYRQGAAAPVQQNDDWGSGGGGAAVAAAAAQAGSFPLAAGSRDSALLVVLDPGAYSAQVSGVGGTAGVALLEIYDVP